MALKGFADLGDLSEDEQITVIAHQVVAHQQIVGFFVDDDAKADRYIQKLLAGYKVRLVGRHGVPATGTILVRVGPAES